MKLSSRSQYAITAMLELALCDKTKPVTLFDIAEKQEISLSYLEQLFARLRKHKLVKGRRGPGGGYMLARPVDEITIADIVSAVDEIPDDSRQPGSTIGEVNSDALWHNLSKNIFAYLGSITLGQFVNANNRESAQNPGVGLSEQGWQSKAS